MKYQEYMSQFTVIDETKSLIFSRMKQRVKQLKAAKIEQTAAVVARKKRSTFRLHPIRWIAIAVSAVLVVAAIPTVYFTAFHKNGDGFNSIKMEYMDNMMVDVDGVTAYSIKSEETKDVTPMSMQTDESKGPAFSLFSATIMEDKTGIQPYANKKKTRNYLYSTNESYEAGNVEYDDTGITRVTFKKNAEVTEDVYDNNGKLIDSNRKITQEEMDGQINKIYTTKEYTFIQFVPMVEKSGAYNYKTADGKQGWEYVYLRPESVTYDENGVANFDQGIPSEDQFRYGYEGRENRTTQLPLSYYSSALSASFVIDNSTGYIYKIENIRIDGFANGLVKSYIPQEAGRGFEYNSSYCPANYYTISTDENHNLVFTDVLPNKDIEVNNVYYDKYEWLYVVNDLLDQVDSDKKIIYTTDKDKYVHDSDKNVYAIHRDSYGVQLPVLNQMIDGVESALSPESVTIKDLRYIWREYKGNVSGSACDLTAKYQNLFVWRRPTYQNYGRFVAYDEVAKSGLAISNDAIGYQPDDFIRWLDNDYDILLSMKDKKLSYVKVDLSECLTSVKTLGTEDFASLSDRDMYEAKDYYLSVGENKYKVNDVYYTVSASGTEYYHAVRTDTGVKLEKLTSKSYSDTVFIFQPINK